jgi:predicted enzyme related to lactoylglutathione lyase
VTGTAVHAPQVGKGTTWVLDTGDCRKTDALLKDRGVKFIQAPETTPWGVQALFVDLYGNPFALMEPSSDRP